MAARAAAFGLSLILLPGCLGAGSVDRSVRPEPRPPAAAAAVTAAPTPAHAGFAAWVEGFRPRALRAGIGAATFARAFAGAAYDPAIVARDRRQPEFTRAIWDYLDSAVSEARIANGRAAIARHGATLDAVAARLGVAREVVAAIWGLESGYGSTRGATPVIGALATLAFDGRRGAFFEEQLVAALRILEAGDVTPERMTGSWAGAMGHTQFIPTSYLAYAVDFGGDGRRDIWGEDPADALASAANYLARHGWKRGEPWGLEVRLPAGLEPRAAGSRRSIADWRAAGLLRADGGALPDHGPAALFLPAGMRGPAFLTFDNFRVIKRYNNADSYALAVGHLADRLAGAGALRAPWPRGDRPLTEDERMELQRRLTAAGFDTGGIDGRIGPATLAAIRAFQTAAGLAPDGYVSLDLLARLRRG